MLQYLNFYKYVVRDFTYTFFAYELLNLNSFFKYEHMFYFNHFKFSGNTFHSVPQLKFYKQKKSGCSRRSSNTAVIYSLEVGENWLGMFTLLAGR